MKDSHQQRLVFGIFFLTPLLYALYTQHAWEDWYITYRASKNLAIGNGLVFQPGERLHTFTSPLGTLVPSLLNWITGNYSDDLVLWLYRVFSSVLLGFSGVLIWQIGRELLKNTVALVVLLLFVLLDAKMVDNSINGMETALMVFFLALTIHAVVRPSNRTVWQLAIGLAGLMWSRPDGFIHATGFLLATLAFPPKEVASRGAWFGHLAKAAVIGALLYVPWLAWATWYYGTPVPNTIIAKGLSRVPTESPWAAVDGLRSFVRTLRNVLRDDYAQVTERLGWLLTPTYYHFGGWPDWLKYLSRTITGLAMLCWLLPGFSRWGRVLSFGAFFSCMYLAHLNYAYPWYIPMGAILCYFTVAVLLDQLLTALKNVAPAAYALRGVAVAILAVQAWEMIAMAYQMRMQQRYIEEGNRKQIGLWLKQNAGSDDNVFLECLGYIGFYSNLKTLDFPGLSSKEVIDARQTINEKIYPDAFPPLVAKMQPDWLVLRDYEIGVITSRTNVLTEKYEVAKVFNVMDRVKPLEQMEGYPYLSWDAKFTVFRHKRLPASQLTYSGTN